MTTTTTTRDKLLAIESNMNERYRERAEFARGLLLAAISGQHIFALGPPGAGKTEMVEDFTKTIDGSIFDLLMMKTTTPDELFGPVEVEAFKAGEFRRSTAGMAPEAHVLSLDEIWKGGSSTLNGLLQLLAQRKFTQGGKSMSCPLLFAVGASNELPQESSLRALYSRFQLRFLIEQVRDQKNLDAILFDDRAELTEERVSIEEILEAQREAAQIPVSKSARKAVRAILEDLREMGVRPDVRKLVALVSERGSLVQAQAWIEGDDSVRPEHLDVLRNALWDTPAQISGITDIILKHAISESAHLLADANNAIELAVAAESGGASIETMLDAIRELKRVESQCKAAGLRLPESVALSISVKMNETARAVIEARKTA